MNRSLGSLPVVGFGGVSNRVGISDAELRFSGTLSRGHQEQRSLSYLRAVRTFQPYAAGFCSLSHCSAVAIS
jgi:hypothetical protein